MPQAILDRYLNYEELTELLRALASQHPDIVSLESIGMSHEGRDIWLVTVTDTGTDCHMNKPAFWADGNIHASEVSASTAVLAMLDSLVAGWANKTKETVRLLQERTFYLVPRFNPDGAEWALESPPRIVRSSTRHYPYMDEDIEGLERQDVDGDGRILSMRIKDPNGPWKVAEQEPRLLKKREPGESGGTYYRVVPEGVVHGYDGMSLRARKIPQGLDMNRNFPSAWRTESEQYGAGPYPTSEVEVRAIVQAITERPNICGGVSFHTFSGVLLRPPSRMPDDDLPPEDIWTFKTLGDKGNEMTGYPAISNFHEFRYHPKEVITGVFDDWMYEHVGVHAWTIEIWSPQRQAGITDYKYIDWFREHPFDDDIKLLKWSDEALDGLGHVDWAPFEHPQLGTVEIGGWDPHYAFRNPPLKFLQAEVVPLAEWALWHAGTGPRLAHRDTKLEPVGEGAVRVRVAVQNTGWLPTNVTEHAKSKKLCRGVIAQITRTTDTGNERPGWLLGGRQKQETGQLRGWCDVPTGGFGWHTDATDDVAVFEWVVAAGADYEVTAWHDRAGRVKLTIST